MLQDLKSRRTAKVIGNKQNAGQTAPVAEAEIAQMLEAAGNAPFHYACDRVHQSEGGSVVPWRVTSLDANACNNLMKRLIETGDATKVPNMLAAAAHMFLVTWLPDDGTISDDPRAKEGPVFQGTLRNMEHLAAASAFCQSLLLAAGSFDYRTYWSSGGPLRGGQVFEWLDIPETQILLGAVFLFPRDVGDAEIKPGALADKRGAVSGWSRNVQMDE